MLEFIDCIIRNDKMEVLRISAENSIIDDLERFIVKFKLMFLTYNYFLGKSKIL